MKNYWILKYCNGFIFLLMLAPLLTFGQQITKEGYYMFPIKPGERNSLSGTMGELRSNHFHAGLDIRTDGHTGLPVHAAADGYISRIAVSVGGYGNALYINHPNGTTTVYGHLDSFKGKVADYVRQKQYENKSFDINLYFDASEFPVKKGDIVALSGNSGSSGGPHVHFDLRDARQDLLNPLSFGFKEIKDHTPPIVEKVVIQSLSFNSRVKGEYGRFEYSPRRVGNDYVIDQPIPVYGEIGLELYSYDKLDNSRFHCGISHIQVEVAGRKSFDQNITTFAFSEQRNILSHLDYEKLQLTGQRYNKLYVDDGNFLRFYDTDQNNGKLRITDERDYPVRVIMTDTYGNTSQLTFTLQGTIPDESQVRNMAQPANPVDLLGNVLKITVPLSKESSREVILHLPEQVAVKPAYHGDDNLATFLWDMQNGLPLSVEYNGTKEDLHFQAMISPESDQHFEDEHFRITFPAHALFDTLYLQTSYAIDSGENREIFKIGNSNIPLRNHISASVVPEKSYSPREKYAMYQLDWRGNPWYQGGSWQGDRFSFSTRDFGRFTLLKDEEPPTILPIKITPSNLSFKIYDKLSGIDKINCYVNGEWVLMNYDYKRQLIWSERKDSSVNFSGEVKLVVTDNVNNMKTFTTKIP